MDRRIKMIGIIVLVLFLAVGFAAVTTNLLINNTANISNNQDDFDVLFTKAKSESGGYASIGTDGKTITYSTKKLSMIGDTATLDYTVKNYSSQYDANVIVSYTAVNEISGVDYSDYYSITMSGFDSSNPTLVTGRNTVDGTITIELLKAITENVSITFTVTMNSNAVERENEAVYSPQYEIVSGDLDTIGSIVKIADEEFYVIGKEDNKRVKLLTKYNIMKNTYRQKENSTYVYSENEEFDGASPYWCTLNQKNALEEYGGYSQDSNSSLNANAKFIDENGNNPIIDIYNNNSNIYNIVENYVDYLNTQGVSVTGRLLNLDETIALGCNPSTNQCTDEYPWVYQTTYWVGYTNSCSNVGTIGNEESGLYGLVNGNIGFTYHGNYGYGGTRPVIILDI
jgi:hypothetical protein